MHIEDASVKTISRLLARTLNECIFCLSKRGPQNLIYFGHGVRSYLPCRAKRNHTTCTSPIKHLVCLPKFCITFVLVHPSWSWPLLINACFGEMTNCDYASAVWWTTKPIQIRVAISNWFRYLSSHELKSLNVTWLIWKKKWQCL